MASDPPVTAQALLQAIHELRRRGDEQLLEQLDEQEPALAEHLMESLSLIHRDLLALGGSVRASQALYREIQALLLVIITALRQQREPADPARTAKPAGDDATDSGF